MASKDFFIYGSFCNGFAHFHKIQGLVDFIRDVQITGTCFRTQIGFPVVMEQGTDRVPGQLMRLDLSIITESFFDELQGYNPMNPELSLTIKKQVSVEHDGEFIEATVYFLNPLKKTSTMSKIEGGDWRESLKQHIPLPEKMTDKQRVYVAKLGSCSGRDIVPIDMTLYRELMNLELIVDKGRRLALSKLGQEVCRYI